MGTPAAAQRSAQVRTCLARLPQGGGDGADMFDAGFFGISPREAAEMDPQQRLFLEEAWHAFEDAGLSDRDLKGARCGIFIGVGQGDYSRHLPMDDPSQVTGQLLLGNTASILVSRIAYLLDLTGPAVAVDGDTLDMNGARVRLFGVDAMEARQTCMKDGQAWACGAEAKALLAESGIAPVAPPPVPAPQLAAQPDIISFTRTTSCGTNTEVSVPCLFSPWGRRQYDEERIHGAGGTG